MRQVHADVVPPVLQPAVRRVLTSWRSRGLGERDLLLAAFPKSGSTWLRFVLASALAEREMDYDLVARVSPPLGRQRVGPLIVPGGGRFVRSHEPPYFTPGARPRTLLLVRDGRDIALSLYHHLRRQGRVESDFDAFLPLFLEGRVGSYGSWQAHTRLWLAALAKSSGTTHVLTYERMLADPQAALAEVVEVFGLGLDGDQIATALDQNSTEKMRGKEASSVRVQSRTKDASISFVREARAGGWREQFTPAQSAAFENVAAGQLQALGYSLS